ncbi:MAG: glycosyltransferase [Planctomycetota bacterium]
MQVTFLTPSISRMGGGISHIVLRVSQCVSQLHSQVQVLGLQDEYSEVDLQDWKPLEPKTFPRLAFQKFGWSPSLRRAMSRVNGTDSLVHQHGIWTYLSVVCSEWRKRTGQPTVISPHGMLEAWALANSQWKKRLATRLYERANLAICSCIQATSESELASIRNFGLNRPVVLIPNGVDIPLLDLTERSEGKKPDADGRKILLFLSRIHPKKGLVNLLRGWAQVTEDAKDWRLVLAGPDEVGHIRQIKQLISDLAIGTSVEYVGPQYGAGKDHWLRRADAFVLPSFSEGFSIAVLEAMAYGLPVLMSPQCNFPEAMRARVALCAEPQVETIARGLRNLFDLSPRDRVELGGRAREFVAREYSWKGVADRLGEVYRWLLGEVTLPGRSVFSDGMAPNR